MPQLTRGTRTVGGCLGCVFLSSSKSESLVFLSVGSLNILFSIRYTLLMHTWACYILSVHTGDNEKCLFIIAVLFLFCVQLFLHINMYVSHGLNAATSQDALLDMRHVIRRLNLHQSCCLFFFLGLFDLRGERAAGSCGLRASMSGTRHSRGHLGTFSLITPSNNPAVL